MKISIIGLALAAVWPGWALAQSSDAPKTFQLVPTETCTPFSRNVILGLCTHTQEAEAKQMIADGTLSRPPPRGPIFGSGATRPAPAAPKGEADVTVRLKADDLGALDAWIAAQPDKPSRAEAIRRLLHKDLGG